MNHWRLAVTFSLVTVVCFQVSQAQPVARHVTPASLDRNTRELFDDAMNLDQHFYDEGAKLVHSPNAAFGAGTRAGRYMVRESSWYALGLLFRDGPGDRQRAAEIIDAVLKQQYLKAGERWYGTYKRTPEEPDPGEDAVIWRAYDPNWRVFIGTTFAMMLIEYPDRIPRELDGRMYAAIDHAIDGEIAEHRLLPTYTNIALMYGFLWDFAAVHGKRADWHKSSAEWNDEVFRLYKQHDAFSEYNSPTYCGVDLYGLALWRDYGSTDHMRKMGSDMEAGLWSDMASYYQPQLRNLSGPFDRAYGMNMEEYVSVVGVWMRTVLDAEHAPLPKITPTTDHVADVWFAPHIAILGTRIPAGALAEMRQFSGEHLVHKQIDDKRAATAWIGNNVIFGGELTHKTKDAGPTSQFHPATVQWRTPGGEVGWAQLVECPMVDVTADKSGLTISTSGTVRFRIHAKNLTVEKISAKAWDLPGLHVAATQDAKNFRTEQNGSAIDLIYSDVTQITLAIPSRN